MRTWKLIILLLLLILVGIVLAAASYPEDKLRIVACDVGQGDSILINYKNTQILVDGGPGNRAVDCLSRHMPFFDRTIELVVLTHPETDHFEGLIEVFRRYEVEAFLGNSLKASNQGFRVLEEEVGGGGTRVFTPDNVTEMRLGVIHLDILHPDKVFYDTNSEESGGAEPGILSKRTTTNNMNEFSVVVNISFGEFDALLTGDILPSVAGKVAEKVRLRNINDIEYLKVPHHGSKNGLTREFLEAVDPEIAVISVGKNQWGHPTKEILEMLEDNNVKIFRTDQMGDVVVETDGRTYEVKSTKY